MEQKSKSLLVLVSYKKFLDRKLQLFKQHPSKQNFIKLKLYVTHYKTVIILLNSKSY